MSAPLPAENVDAERAILSVILQSPRAIATIRGLITVDEFYRPAHQAIYQAMCTIADAGDTVDPVRLLGELSRNGQLKQYGDASYIATLYGLPAVSVNIDYYAEQLREASGVRQLEQVIARLDQARRQLAGNYDAMMTRAAREAVALEMLVDAKVRAIQVTGLHTWEDFLAQPDRVEDFVVPGFIERKDVWMLLGSEGGGKSFLSRQMCQAIAAGIHPFRPHQRIPAHRTLLIDIENPESMVRRQSRGMHHQVSRLGVWQNGMGHVWLHPAGLNLRKIEDQQLLEQVIIQTEPAFVAFGSLYKAYQQGSDSWEAAAEEVRAVFDRLRARYDIALWLEHHMPKGDGTTRPQLPFGSSVWMRWAAFGRVINRVGENAYELAMSFRGDRDVRDVPVGLYRGGELPWAAIWDPDELNHLRFKKGEGPK